ncbi:MAG TPA: hypothetical protein VLU46_01885 [Thermoanaerobaculia bacterium]|nr:hypothetical protein [Thermoanaerobaculia bacterium]
MKRLRDLAPTDLQRCPVWRYDGEGDDVAVLHATEKRELSDPADQVYIAETQFVLANGAHHIGFCTPAEEDDVETLQPVIVTGAGHVYFSFDEPPSREFLRAQWELLGASREEIFPVHFRCMVPVNGRYITGTIEAEDLTGAA